MSVNSAAIGFHPEAARRFDQLTQEILGTIQGLGNAAEVSPQKVDFHPIGTIHPEDILEQPKLVYEVDALGDPAGVFWISRGMRVGWIGPVFQPIKALVDSMAQTKPFREFVSYEFLLHQTCEWLCETLERRRSDALSEHIAARSHDTIKDHEIWIPVFRTYSSTEFSIGDVRFRTITREIMD